MSETGESVEVDSTPSSTEPALRDRVLIWLAIAITVVVSLPFGLWLGDYNLPLWVSFIVWAGYFVLGARPAALKVMIPAFLTGAWLASTPEGMGSPARPRWPAWAMMRGAGQSTSGGRCA